MTESGNVGGGIPDRPQYLPVGGPNKGDGAGKPQKDAPDASKQSSRLTRTSTVTGNALGKTDKSGSANVTQVPGGTSAIKPTVDSEKKAGVENTSAQTVKQAAITQKEKKSGLFATLRRAVGGSKTEQAQQPQGILSDHPEVTSKAGKAELRLMEIVGQHTETKGLFRVEGNSTKASKLKENILSKPEKTKIELKGDEDIQVVTTTLKRIITDNPVFSGAAKNDYINAGDANKSEGERVQLLKDSIGKLNPEQKAIIKEFLSLSESIVSKSETNMMTPKNIAISAGVGLYQNTDSKDMGTLASELSKGENAFILLFAHRNEMPW